LGKQGESSKTIQNETESVCDVMKEQTSKLTQKMESQMPLLVQYYSDLYKAYLHSFDDVFGSCYTSEKQYFEKLGIDKKTIKAFEEYTDSLTDIYSSNIDVFSNFLKEYVKMRISAIETFDRYVHVMMDTQAKISTQYNKILEKTNDKSKKVVDTNWMIILVLVVAKPQLMTMFAITVKLECVKLEWSEIRIDLSESKMIISRVF